MISRRVYRTALGIGRSGFVLAGWMVACGGSLDPAPPLWVGKIGEHLPASTAGNVFWVAAAVNGRPGPLLIMDTGAPTALFNVEAFDGAVTPGVGRVATLTLGGITFWKVPTLGITGDTSLAPNGEPVGGLIGYTVFGQLVTSFDYRDSRVVLGPASLPGGLLPPVDVPFILEGGGTGPAPQQGGLVTFPASRINLRASIEGKPATLLLDTGASWVALRTGHFAALTSDGRGQVTDNANLAEGDTTTNVTRLRSVSVRGAEVTGAVAASAARIDELLDNLSAEVGHPIDGLLGAPFLREFYVAVDYPGQQVAFHRYTARDHVRDRYHRVGIDIRGLLGRATITYFVARVLAGTDAARQQIAVGERLVAIDDVSLDTLDVATVESMLLGPVGSSRRLAFVDRELVVEVEELLPLP